MDKAFLRWLNPLNWFRWMSQFTLVWIQSFPFRQAKTAIPALLALVLLGLALILTFTSSADWRRRLVMGQFREAKENRSNEQIALLARRMLRGNSSDAGLRFDAAVATAEIAYAIQANSTTGGGDGDDQASDDQAAGDDGQPTAGQVAAVEAQVDAALAAQQPADSPQMPAGTDILILDDGQDQDDQEQLSAEEIERNRKLAQGQAALRELAELAINDNHGPSAIWLLENEYTPIAWNKWDSEKQRLFGELLDVAAKEFPDNPTVSSVYTDHLLRKGEYEAAIAEITKLVTVQPLRALQGAVLLTQSGRKAQADDLVRQGAEALKQRGDEEPENADVALLRTQFAVYLKRYDSGVALLNRTARLNDDPRLRAALAEVLVLWSRDQESIADPTERFARQLKLLGQATQLAPNHPLVLEDLMSVVLKCSTEDDPQVTQLREVLVQGVAPELAHFIRGTAAMMKGDTEAATLHLELAAESLKLMPAVLNNLAVALATHDDQQLDRAYTLVSTAIEKVPNQPHFYETRAQIQLKQGRYQEAVLDFERAMAAPALRQPAHTGLAKAYAELGQTELSQRHQSLADQLLAAPESQTNGQTVATPASAAGQTATPTNAAGQTATPAAAPLPQRPSVRIDFGGGTAASNDETKAGGDETTADGEAVSAAAEPAN